MDVFRSTSRMKMKEEKQLDDLKDPHPNQKILRRKMVELGRLERNVEVWLKKVQKIKNEVCTIEEILGKERTQHSHFELEELIAKKTKEVVGLIYKVVVHPMQDSGNTLYTRFRSTTEKTSEMIWNCLTDTGIGIIGVYGAAGVGKTAIMSNICDRLRETEIFDNVIWVNVSKSLNFETMQNIIAKAVGAELYDYEDENKQAFKLYSSLYKKKKFVLILDDLPHGFSLDKVGVLRPDKYNGCKLVLITKFLAVCRHMGTQREVKVKVLSEEEAWDMFKKNVGDHVVFAPEVEEIARVVAADCVGLPLIITTVGRAMRGMVEIEVWKNALIELRGSMAKGIKYNVLTILKFCYDRLKNEKLRACLLYCALYPEEHEIETRELIEYWMGEELINDVGNREAEVEEGNEILNELINACMLERVVDKDNIECIKMHHLIRDMAIKITGASPRYLVKAGLGLKEQFDEEWVENVEKISLMKNDIQWLPDRPKCPKLSTLLLQYNNFDIYSSFFEQMCGLRVLDLSHTWICFLPESISDLRNLRALLLCHCCQLIEIPSLAKLNELRVLDLSYTPIEELPRGTESLVNLRRLDLSNTRKLEVFPSGVLPKLPRLEDLSVYGRVRECICPWNLAETGAEIGIDDITSLTQLANLCIQFIDIPCFVSYLRSGHWRKLKSFHLGVGSVENLRTFSKLDSRVEIQSCNFIGHEEMSLELPHNTHWLKIQSCHDITQLSCLLKNTELKECYISNCDGLEFIVATEENLLSSLDTLSLRNLPNVRSLCRGVEPHVTLQNLRRLHVLHCNNLKNLFSHRLLQNIVNLVEIKVEYCKLMEDLVEEDEVGDDSASHLILPKLECLELRVLPELKCISRKAFLCCELLSVKVKSCSKLKKLPLSGGSRCRTLEGEKTWWDSLVWDDGAAKGQFQPLFREL